MSGSTPVRTVGNASTIVTSLPRCWYAPPSSIPMMPPPMMSMRLGISRRLTASLAPMICLPSNLKLGISMVVAPLAMTIALVAWMTSVVPSRVFTETVLGPVTRASP